jgi:hypothetical protein
MSPESDHSNLETSMDGCVENIERRLSAARPIIAHSPRTFTLLVVMTLHPVEEIGWRPTMDMISSSGSGRRGDPFP